MDEVRRFLGWLLDGRYPSTIKVAVKDALQRDISDPTCLIDPYKEWVKEQWNGWNPIGDEQWGNIDACTFVWAGQWYPSGQWACDCLTSLEVERRGGFTHYQIRHSPQEPDVSTRPA